MSSNFMDAGSSLTGYTSSSSKTQSQKSVATITSSRYRFPSIWAYVCSLNACSLSLRYFNALVVRDNVDSENIVQYVCAYVFVTLPLQYLLTLLGQYTQMNVNLVRNLCPIGSGVALSYINNMFVHCVMNGLLLADITSYFLSSMRKELQWMKCPEDMRDTCWNGSECFKNCLTNTTKSSAYHYFVKIYMENAIVNTNTTNFIGIPSLSRAILISVSWVITCAILAATYSAYRKFFVVVFELSLALIIFNMLAGVLNLDKNIRRNIFNIKWETFLKVQNWAMVISKPIQYLGLGRAFHLMYGSYMPHSSPSGTTSTCAIVFNFLIVVMISLFVRCRLLKLQQLAHLDAEHEKYIWDPGLVTYFIHIPFSLGLTSLRHFWIMQYFFMCILTLLNNQISHIIALERIMSEQYPSLLKYRTYVLGGIALSAGLTGISMSSSETYLIYKTISNTTSKMLEVFNAMVLSFIVCYVYGVQKLCDDIHFMRGAQLSNYWKISWYALPLVMTLTYYYVVFVEKSTGVIGTIEMWTFFILISPVPIAAVIEAFRYVKRRDILGMFQSQERFGPPDPKERYLRRMFNPREEIRAHRKSEACQHKCLLNSKSLMRVMQAELGYKQAPPQ